MSIEPKAPGWYVVKIGGNPKYIVKVYTDFYKKLLVACTSRDHNYGETLDRWVAQGAEFFGPVDVESVGAEPATAATEPDDAPMVDRARPARRRGAIANY